MTWRCLCICIILQRVNGLNVENKQCLTVSDYFWAPFSPNCPQNTNLFSTIPQVIHKNGFRTETHTVTTDDGYILQLFRIFSKDINASTTQIFMLHGILVTASSWIDTDNNSLAFYIAERGYDVWLGAIRGSIYSNKHTTLTVNDPEYWEFNLDTLTEQDLKLQLNFIANLTQEKIIIIGHSMGTTLSFMFSSASSQQASSLLKGIIALAPVAYIKNTPLLNIVQPFGLPLDDMLSVLNINGLFYQEDFFHCLLINACKLFPEVCYFVLSNITGFSKLFPPEDLLIFFNSWPSGTSIYALRHYLQIAQSNQFQKYDYGSDEKNIDVYGTNSPPVYDLSTMQVPVALFYGENDFLFNAQNLERLFDEIGSDNKLKMSVSSNEEYRFNHENFIFATNITEYLYSDLFNVLQSFDDK